MGKRLIKHEINRFTQFLICFLIPDIQRGAKSVGANIQTDESVTTFMTKFGILSDKRK